MMNDDKDLWIGIRFAVWYIIGGIIGALILRFFL